MLCPTLLHIAALYAQNLLPRVMCSLGDDRVGRMGFPFGLFYGTMTDYFLRPVDGRSSESIKTIFASLQPHMMAETRSKGQGYLARSSLTLCCPGLADITALLIQDHHLSPATSLKLME